MARVPGTSIVELLQFARVAGDLEFIAEMLDDIGFKQPSDFESLPNTNDPRLDPTAFTTPIIKQVFAALNPDSPDSLTFDPEMELEQRSAPVRPISFKPEQEQGSVHPIPVKLEKKRSAPNNDNFNSQSNQNKKVKIEDNTPILIEDSNEVESVAVQERHFDLNIDDAKFLSSWKVRHGLREIISNALDEHAICGIDEDIVIQEVTVHPEQPCWEIRDFGRGLSYRNLKQGQSDEKLENASKVIGQFGVGLKDALASFSKANIGVTVHSKFQTFELCRTSKHGFTDVIVLQAVVKPPKYPQMEGTRFILEGVRSKEVQKAKDLFMRYNQVTVLDNVVISGRIHGQILEKVGTSKIYVKGLQVAQEKGFLFSYNLIELTAPMRKALNRERTHVGRTAYSSKVKSLLLNSTSNTVLSQLAEDLSNQSKGTSHDEVGWMDVAAHACQLLEQKKETVFVRSDELANKRDVVLNAEARGKTVVLLPDSVYERVQTNPTITTLDSFRNNLIAKIVPQITQTINPEEQKLLRQAETVKKWVSSALGRDFSNFQVKIADTLGDTSSQIFYRPPTEIVFQRAVLERPERFIKEICAGMALTYGNQMTHEYEKALLKLLHYFIEKSFKFQSHEILIVSYWSLKNSRQNFHLPNELVYAIMLKLVALLPIFC